MLVLGYSFQLSPRQPGEGSSLVISKLNSSIKYKGGAKTCRLSVLCGMSLTCGLERETHRDTVALKHTKKHDTYLGLNISTTGNFHKAVNDLRDKARRAFYAIKRNIKFDIPIHTKPIALHGCVVRGPPTNQ